MKAKSIKGETPEEIKSSLHEISNTDFNPTLGFVFVGINQNIEAITKVFEEERIQIVGATTSGEIGDGTTLDYSISVLLLDLNKDYFQILREEIDADGYRKASATIAKRSQDFFEESAFIVLGSGVHQDLYLEQLLNGFVDVLGEHVAVYGGMSDDHFNWKQSFVFTDNGKSTHAVVAVAFDSGKVELQGVATCGWRAIGTGKKITKSSNNTVFEIEGVNALELVAKYAGIKDIPESFYDLHVELNQSLQIELQRKKRNPILRTGIVNMEDGSINFMGKMDEGAEIKFCLLPDLDAIDESIDSNQTLRETKMPDADAVLIFMCAGRLFSFGPEIKREVEGIKKVWGNIPIAGFFSQGEFCKTVEGQLDAYNLNTVCVALKEK